MLAPERMGQPDRASQRVRRLPDANAAPDPGIVSWSHVYLGRLHDFAEERDQARCWSIVPRWRFAGAPEAARVAAQRGIDAPYNPRGASGSSGANGASAPPKQ